MEIRNGYIYKISCPGLNIAGGLALVVGPLCGDLIPAILVRNDKKPGCVDLGGGLCADPGKTLALPEQAFEEETGAAASGCLEQLLRARAVEAALDCLRARGERQPRMAAAGKSIGAEELTAMVEASLDMWLTAGRFHEQFELRLAQLFGACGALAVNSGSSANLLAVATLCSHKLGARRLKPGDEVITVAAAFPTTVAPLLQHGLVPVFADVEPATCNVKAEQLECCLSPRTKAVFLAHTLGNPFNASAVAAFCKKNSLWFIEDNCDSLDSLFKEKLTGTFGHLATLSFYPAHHITTGEGGALIVNDAALADIALSLRDWGRDCKCPTGKDGVCGARFSKQLGKLPLGYDHKYTYSHLGYNLKMTDWQAAIGLAQLQKLTAFTARRKRNFGLLHRGMSAYGEHLLLPAALPDAEPAWFGYPIMVRKDAPFPREKLTEHLEKNGIGTRTLFGGNLLRQPAFTDDPQRLRILDSGPLLSTELGDSHYALLPGTEAAMTGTFWIGLWPGLGDAQMEAILATMREFFAKKPT
ncbi:MAG TPA: lipopolysaccharide biosynthesis protein RfbH [Elusimicrobiales bacterium]|nr:lipopolysaccharide biosynthesis protein RfbH [Elusimicrobiales bacterium]